MNLDREFMRILFAIINLFPRFVFRRNHFSSVSNVSNKHIKTLLFPEKLSQHMVFTIIIDYLSSGTSRGLDIDRADKYKCEGIANYLEISLLKK